MAVGSMQLMGIWQKKNLKKERLSMLAYLSKTNTCEGKTITTNQWGSAGSLVDLDQ